MTTMDPTVRRPKRVAFLSADAEAVSAVSERLTTKGVEVLGFSDVKTLSAGMGPSSDTILVLDSRTLPRDQDVARLLDRIERLCGGRPVLICIAPSQDIDLRLQALRAGAEAFFAEPVAVEELAARLLELSGAADSGSYRVLVVDDQPVAALFAARVLELAGMRTRIAANALRVLELLEEFRPHLVLMDLHMPGADGIELTTLIREHDDFYDTPVIFLSSELDAGKQMDALRGGGNDFIAKPVRPERLVEVVRRGIRAFEKTQGRQHARHERDWATGLMGRSAFLKRLGSSIACSVDQEPGHGVLAIDINVLHTGAHSAAQAQVDSLMERLADRLRGRLEATECAARHGDSGFAILARRESEGALLELANALGAELASAARRVPIQVSVGIGRFHSPVDDAMTVISRADEACGQARKEGGSRVRIYRPPAPDGSHWERDASLVRMIEAALRSEAFHLMYQPIVALGRKMGERYDTTLRLKAPKGEYIPTIDILRVAQRRGRIPAIDRWVMTHALDRLRQERDTRQRLRFFVHQTMETLSADDWLPWFRDQIVERDLIKQRPILQFQLDDLSANRALASIRFGELRRLAIVTCLNILEDNSQVLGLIRELRISLVRLPLPSVAALDGGGLTDFVERAHAVGAKVIVARIEHPQAIAQVFGCGVDFIQGNFLQLPSEELSFDFTESSLVERAGFAML